MANWACEACEVSNHDGLSRCHACRAPRPWIFTFPTAADKVADAAASSVAPTLAFAHGTGAGRHHFARSIVYGAVAAAVLVTLTVGGFVVSGGQNNTRSGPAQGDVAKAVPTQPPARRTARPATPAPTPGSNGQAVYGVGDSISLTTASRDADGRPTIMARLRVFSISPWRGDSRWRPTCAGCRAVSADVSIQVPDSGSGGHSFCLATSTIVAVSVTGSGTTAIRSARSPALQLGCKAAGSSDHGFLTYLLLDGETFDHLEVRTSSGVAAIVRP